MCCAVQSGTTRPSVASGLFYRLPEAFAAVRLSNIPTVLLKLGETTMKKLVAGLATITFVLGTFACGGAKKAPDAGDAADDSGKEKKSLEKFEGSKMETADEEE